MLVSDVLDWLSTRSLELERLFLCFLRHLYPVKSTMNSTISKNGDWNSQESHGLGVFMKTLAIEKS